MKGDEYVTRAEFTALVAEVRKLKADRRPTDEAAAVLLEELVRVCELGTFTAPAVFESGDRHVRAALEDAGVPTPQALAYWLRSHRGRCVAGGVLVRVGKSDRGTVWRFA